MRTVEEAWDVIGSVVKPLAPERVALGSVLGRVLREEVVADGDMPAFSRSAMDGYLILEGESERSLSISGEVRPSALAQMPTPGTAIRVFTGSAVPDVGVAVVMQEDVEREGERIRLIGAPDAGHIRTRGSHGRRGDVVLGPGMRLTPGCVGLLAAAGVSEPLVSPEIGVAHLATGLELVGHDAEPGEGQIRDSNSPMLEALLADWGASVVWHGMLGEDSEELHAAIADAGACGPHLLLIGGGASAGDHDHTAAALREAGFEILIEGVASRPGKPLIFGARDGLLAFGIPGNPLSHFVCFHLFVRRAIDLLRGSEPPQPTRLAVAESTTVRAASCETWWPCRLAWRGESPVAVPLPWRDSSDILCLADIGGLLRVTPHGIGADGASEVLLTRDIGVMEKETPADEAMEFSHIGASGEVRMVDVGAKPVQLRTAIASGEIHCRPATLAALAEGALPKGDVLATARIAGIQAAKRTAELVPLCHALPLDKVSIGFVVKRDRIEILAEVICRANTGVEMEALTAVNVAALTLYDMMKAVDKGMRIEAIRLVEKRKV